jgi:hypothetical protein
MRNKKTREAIACSARLKAVVKDSMVEVLWIVPSRTHLEICTLEEADRLRRPSYFFEAAADSVQSGFRASVVTRIAVAMDGTPAQRAVIQDAGGRFFSRRDVHNASAAWGRANPDPSHTPRARRLGDPASCGAGMAREEGLHASNIQVSSLRV